MNAFKGRKLLVVDDSRMIRHALVDALRQNEALVQQAENGALGLRAAQREAFDLVITDVEMPEMDGYQLCQAIKADPLTRATPVVILTSRDNDEDIERGFDVGADAYASKVGGREEFLEQLNDLLSRIAFRQDQLVLLVEDNDQTRERITRALTDAGFQVASTKSAEQALEELPKRRPNLILSDRDMPGLGGMALCRKVHQNPALADVPFVMMSRNGDQSTMRQALQFGASSFLVKPFNMDQLVLGLEQLLSSQFRLLLKERERLETEGQMMLASITALAEALEARDPYTRGHSDAVAEIAVGIARCMGLEEQELDNLRIGGRLHDIGKIGVPDDILLKPGRLTDEEFAVIKRHPTVGAGILAPIPSLAEVLPVVEQHHEHFDGNGYPLGLAGESISLNARITAVADCYDALTSDRPYRQGMSHEEALAIIRELRGSQLCPDCVDAFIGWTGRIADFGRRHLRAFG